MPSNKHILFVSAIDTPFVRDDLTFFESRAKVTALIGSGPVQAGRISAHVASADIVFCWFASVYAAIAVLAGRSLKKRCVIQVGGVDLAKEDGIGYGLWTSPWRAGMVKQALKVADVVLAVDESLGDEARLRAEYDGRNVEVLPTGFNADVWIPEGEKEPVVACVASVPDQARVTVKGLDTLMDTARILPDVRFSIIGVRGEVVPSLRAPDNVEIHPWIPQESLRVQLQKSKVYCQPSRREGLSNALCEAMLCECVPVATIVGGNPRAVGNTGLLVEPNDPPALARALSMALTYPASHGREARLHVMKHFSRERRQKRLTELLGL